MSKERLNDKLKAITIVDDNDSARQAYEFLIEDINAKPILEHGPLPDLNEFLSKLKSTSNALLCDYRLKTKVYSSYDGDELVTSCYNNNFPAILCTSYTDYDVTLLRSKRRYIPVLIKPNNLEPEIIISSFEQCINEFNGEYSTHRKPWKTLIRIDEVLEDEKYFYVVISGWNPNNKIRLYFDDFPKEFHKNIKSDFRFYAEVNVGAENKEDLYVDTEKLS